MADHTNHSAGVPRGKGGILIFASWVLAGALAASAGVAFAQAQSIPGLVVTTTPPPPPRERVAPPKAEAKPKPAPRPRREASRAPARDEGSGSGGRDQGIVLLVNDQPITGYEIEQRATLMAASSGGGQDMRARAEARWKQIIQDPKTNERFQAFLREKQPKSKDQAVALQKQFTASLQSNMIAQLRRETRASNMAKFRTEAREELIDERLKVQEGKRLTIAPTSSTTATARVTSSARPSWPTIPSSNAACSASVVPTTR
jgi:peptidyl-prolyl cis-trans isomerase SurA